MTTEYQGFTIDFISNGVTIDSGRYYVKAEGFKPDGYASLNAAKGAITKYLKASESQDSVFVQSVINTKSQPAEALKADKVAVPVVAVQVKKSRNKREGRYNGNFGGKAVRDLAYAGPVWSDSHYNANRKQRKALQRLTKEA